MDDNVRYLCNDDTHTPTDSTKANGFPFKFIDTKGGNNPVAVDYDHAMRPWWRIRNWGLTSTCAAHLNGADTSFDPTLIANVGNAARELDLINPTTPHSFQSGNAALFINTDYFKDNSGVWPSLNIFGAGNATFLFAGGSPRVDFSLDPNLPASPTGNFSGMIDGTTVTIYYTESGFGMGDTFTPGTFILEATEYWPFSGLDGDPIYDTTTGQLLSGRHPWD